MKKELFPPTITWSQGCVKLIDQTKLPHKLQYIYCRDVKTLWKAIKILSVRGAPALGVAAGFGVLLALRNKKFKDTQSIIKTVFEAAAYIATSRPTAVNLFHVLDRMKKVALLHQGQTVAALLKVLRAEAFDVYEQDRSDCRAMGKLGSTLIKQGNNVLTVCNAGALATVDYGTALGVMYSAKEKNKRFQVYACETRPLLQGARLTAWELLRAKIDTTLICDNMAATLMRQKKIDIIFTGADRIAVNGDTANKIGTYSLAVLAKYHKIPFYVVAPFSTFDLNIASGVQIPIEERGRAEVCGFGSVQTAPSKVKVYNPAFDVTDHKLITGIVTERGILKSPFKGSIKNMLKGS